MIPRNRRTAVGAVLGLMLLTVGGCDSATLPTRPPDQDPVEPPPVAAGYSISGIVTGRTANGSSALTEATVWDEYTHRTVATAADGSFTLTDLGGDVILDITKAGYEGYRQPFVLHGDLRIDVELVPRP